MLIWKNSMRALVYFIIQDTEQGEVVFLHNIYRQTSVIILNRYGLMLGEAIYLTTGKQYEKMAPDGLILNLLCYMILYILNGMIN